jgi:AmiR/NasT family two-component response regulator
VIEQAKGILMAEHRVGPDEAFGLLRTRSTRSNIKLRVIAEQIVAEISGS